MNFLAKEEMKAYYKMQLAKQLQIIDQWKNFSENGKLRTKGLVNFLMIGL